jgi:hypothetical protein
LGIIGCFGCADLPARSNSNLETSVRSCAIRLCRYSRAMAQNLGVNVVGLHPRLRESFRLFELSPELLVQHASSPLYRNLKLSQRALVSKGSPLLGAKLGANLFC